MRDSYHLDDALSGPLISPRGWAWIIGIAFAALLIGGASGAFAIGVGGMGPGSGNITAAQVTNALGYTPAVQTSGTSILSGDGAGGFANVTIGANISFSGGTLSASGVGGTAPLTSGHIFVGNASNVATDVPLSVDATLANTGAITVSSFNGGTAFGTAAGAATGTSGGTLCLLNGTCTISGVWTFGAGDLKLTSAANGDIASFGVANVLADSGTLLSSLAPKANATMTGSFTATGLVTLADLATQATNTVLVNATSGTASPTAQSVSTCSTAASALIWTTNTGFGCNTSITANAVPAANLTGSTLAAGVTASSLTSVGAQLTMSGNISAASWTTSGIGLITGANTYTDTTSSGTVAVRYEHRINGTTVASSSATTYTTDAEVFIGPPAQSGNATITTPEALRLGGALDLAGNNLISAGNVTGSTAGSFRDLNSACSSTVPDILPSATNGTTGIGCNGNTVEQEVSGASVTSAAATSYTIKTGIILGGSAPTLSGTCTSGTQHGGNTAGDFLATCTAQTVILTFATTAPTGWVCAAKDTTTVADVMNQTASSTTTCTLTGTTVASDKIIFTAMAY